MPESVQLASLGSSTYEPVAFIFGTESSAQKKKSPLNWKKVQRLWNRGWGVEGYGIALATSSPTAIFGIIVSHDGKTLPEWPFNIIINALISVFTVLMKTGLAVLDPFSQQLVGVVDCARSEIDSPMAVAINTGLVNPPNHIPSLVSTTCPSGNCTFGMFSSVAVCHSCADISSQIKNLTKTTGYHNYSLPATDNDDRVFATLNITQYIKLNTSVALTPNQLLNER
ncbi:hypothetical protein GQX73_g635 [Xylaria multiplex]|uniref:Uncharacterized protein n=1 Tax=Xylaria multiplex TaxID=323545 RepID=A0A7C8N103_9PEZI|nr:hypothetical protein GQX73_g635 [Xylaria multiplex]